MAKQKCIVCNPHTIVSYFAWLQLTEKDIAQYFICSEKCWGVYCINPLGYAPSIDQ